MHWLRKENLKNRIRSRIDPDITSEANHDDHERTDQMGKIPTQTFDLLQDGQYILRVKHIGDPERSEYAGEPTMQVVATLEVVEALTPGNEKLTDGTTDAVGFTYDEWWSLDPKTGAVKQNSKFWQIYEAATGMKLDIDDEIDTDDMIGKDFQAKVVVNKPGTRNRTEYESYGKARKKRGKPGEQEPEQEEKTPEELTEEELDDLPF